MAAWCSLGGEGRLSTRMLTIVNDNHVCQGILSGVMIGANKKKLSADGFRRGGVEGERRWMHYRGRDAIRDRKQHRLK
jgi:hypothetical protein